MTLNVTPSPSPIQVKSISSAIAMESMNKLMKEIQISLQESLHSMLEEGLKQIKVQVELIDKKVDKVQNQVTEKLKETSLKVGNQELKIKKHKEKF